MQHIKISISDINTKYQMQKRENFTRKPIETSAKIDGEKTQFLNFHYQRNLFQIKLHSLFVHQRITTESIRINQQIL